MTIGRAPGDGEGAVLPRLAYDGVHPANGYDIMAGVIESMLKDRGL